jgi:regulatory protein
MPVVTQISDQKRRPNRRNIFLDGSFAFGCNLNVVAKFKLRQGMALSDEQVRHIQLGEVKQECFDRAMQYLGSRLHSRSEIRKKLMRRQYGDAVVDAVLEDLARLGYVNDERFARTKALSAAQHKHHGRRRAFLELMKAGVSGETADKAVGDVFAEHDSTAVARGLAQKQAARLRKLDPVVARRRLVGMLQRRGFDYESIKPVVDEVLGGERDD